MTWKEESKRSGRAFFLQAVVLVFAMPALPVASASSLHAGGPYLPGMQREHVPEADSQAAAAATNDIRALLAGGSYAAAEARIRALMAEQPGSAEPQFLLGYTLFREQRWTESLAAYTSAARLREPSADDLVVVASDYIQLKSYGDAERWLSSATQMSPRAANAWYLLGRTDYNLDHSGDAERALLQCLELEPDHLRAMYNLGLVYERLDRPSEAIAWYERAIDLQARAPRKDAQPDLDLGMLLLRQGQPAAALAHLQEAVHLAAKNPLAHEQLALCLEKLGRLTEAAAEMRACSELDPQAQAPVFFLGRILQHQGKAAEAKQQFERARKLAGGRSISEVRNFDPESN